MVIPKIPYERFVEDKIRTLRKPPYKGIHVVFSGFNKEFRQYYGEDPRPVIDRLVRQGFLKLTIVRQGAIITLTSDFESNTRQNRADKEQTATATTARQQAEAKVKATNLILIEMRARIRQTSEALSRRNTSLFKLIDTKVQTGEISREEAVELLELMESLAWSSLEQTTLWIDSIGRKGS